jgi:hypothetical protein
MPSFATPRRAALPLICAVSVLGGASVARAEPPTPEEAKKVFDFLEKGAGQGIVVVDAKLCADVPAKGDHHAECVDEFTGEIPSGTKVNVWLELAIPKGDTVADLTAQIQENGTVRETKDIHKLDGGAFLQRTWTAFTARKPGTWTVVLLRGDKALKTLTLKVEKT